MNALTLVIHGKDEHSSARQCAVNCGSPPKRVQVGWQRLGSGGGALRDGSCDEQTNEKESDTEKPRVIRRHSNGAAAEHKQIPQQFGTVVDTGQTLRI